MCLNPSDWLYKMIQHQTQNNLNVFPVKNNDFDGFCDAYPPKKCIRYVCGHAHFDELIQDNFLIFYINLK